MKIKTQFFRANVGIAVTDGRGRVLAFERVDAPGSWQLPQGGLDLGEEPWPAALRELEEETGLGAEAVDKVAEHPDWLAYELPEDRRRPALGRGQVQKWFLVRLKRPDAGIDPNAVNNPEFRDRKWVTLEELLEEVVPFRQPIYRRLAEEFGPLLGEPPQEPPAKRPRIT